MNGVALRGARRGDGVTWLVTGAAGYVGGYVVRAMLRAGHRVVAFDDLSTGDPAVLPADVALVRGCVTDSAALRRTMVDHGVEAVIHLAARKSVGESVTDPVRYYRQNVDGTLALVEALIATGVGRVVLSSSAAVYGSPDLDAVTEDTPPRPANPYGETKLACEWIIRDAAAAYGLEHVCLRYFNVAGCAATRLRDRGGGGLIPRALTAVVDGANPVLLGRDYPTPDGSCVRDFVHVADVAAAHVMVARALQRGRCAPVYNVGSGVGRSVLEVLDTIQRVTGAAFAVQTADRRPGDPARVVACIDRIREEVGWTPRHSFVEMVRGEWRARLAVAEPAAGSAPGRRRGRAGPVPAAAVDGSPVSPGRPAGRGRVVLVGASLGAGHDGAAREWAARLREQGFDTDTHDFLALLPAPMRRGVRDGYQAMLTWAPWSYSLVFRLAAVPGARALIRWLLAPFGRRMLRLLPADTVAVLSTYPLASQLLGRLRRRGELAAPVATFLTDFSVHRMWVAPGVDAHYALHEVSADQARALHAAEVTVTGPLVGARFGPGSAAARRRARRRLGLPVGERLALLVAGSWGVGEVECTTAEIARTGVAAPVVVCGRNVALRERLDELSLGHPLGWVTDMPELMRAVDVLVENAGGLTSLEAMASGLPVATYRPIPGHGRTNAAALDRAGVSSWIRDEDQLAATLTELIDGGRGRRQRRAALALFAADPTRPLVQAAAGGVRPPGRRAGGGRHWMRWAAAAVVLVMLNATVGTRLAVAHGLDSLRPGHRDAAFLVVHPSPAVPIDAATIRLLAGLHAGVAVDDALIRAQPEAVRTLAGAGLTLVNAGSGPPYQTGIVGGRKVIARNAAAIRRLTGRRPAFYLAGRDVDAVDVGTVSYLGEDIVQPGMRILGDGPPPRLPRGKIVLVECATRPPCELTLTLTLLRAQAADQPMRLGSLTELDR